MKSLNLTQTSLNNVNNSVESRCNTSRHVVVEMDLISKRVSWTWRKSGNFIRRQCFRFKHSFYLLDIFSRSFVFPLIYSVFTSISWGWVGCQIIPCPLCPRYLAGCPAARAELPRAELGQQLRVLSWDGVLSWLATGRAGPSGLRSRVGFTGPSLRTSTCSSFFKSNWW